MLGFGEKFGQMIFAFGSFFGGIIIAFTLGPAFAPIALLYCPIFFVIIMMFGALVKKATIAKLAELKVLGGHTEETFSALKLVISFAQEDVTLGQYDNHVDKAR